MNQRKRAYLLEHAVDIPCNGCTECCKRDTIYMHPECGDDSSQYETELCELAPRDYESCGEARMMLRHRPNGDCWYLGDNGCTIHDDPPVTCREFDCRMFLTNRDLKSCFPSKDWRRICKAAKALVIRIRKQRKCTIERKGNERKRKRLATEGA